MTEPTNTRALNAFAAMSRIPDDFVLAAEQMLQEAEAGISRPQKPVGGFRRFLNSGWGAAVISGMVALAVLAFIIHAGVNPPATYEPPTPPAGSTIEMSTEGVNYILSTELKKYPEGTERITAVMTGKTKGETVYQAAGWHLERLTSDGAEPVGSFHTDDYVWHEPDADQYARITKLIYIEEPLTPGTYRLHATKYDGEKYVSVAWCEFTVGSEQYPPEAENNPYNLFVPNTTYGSVNITVTVTAKEKGEALPAIGRGWKVVKLAGPANTGNTGIMILEYGVEAGDPPDADSYATYTESLILEDSSAWLPGIYRLHDLNSKGESVAHCDFVIYEEGYVPLTTENPDRIVVPGIFLWANNTPMVVLMDFYDELYPEPNPTYAATADMYPILLVNDQRDGGSNANLHSGSVVEVEIGKKLTYPHYGDLYALRVVTEGTLNDVDPDWLTILQEAGYTIRDTAEAEAVDPYGFYEGGEVLVGVDKYSPDFPEGDHGYEKIAADYIYPYGSSKFISGLSGCTIEDPQAPATLELAATGSFDGQTLYHRQSYQDESGLYRLYADDSGYDTYLFDEDGRFIEYDMPADGIAPFEDDGLAIRVARDFLLSVGVEITDAYTCTVLPIDEHNIFLHSDPKARRTTVLITRNIGGMMGEGYVVYCGGSESDPRVIYSQAVNPGMYEAFGYVTAEQIGHTRKRLQEAIGLLECYVGATYRVTYEVAPYGREYLMMSGNHLYLCVEFSPIITDPDYAGTAGGGTCTMRITP